MRSVITPGETYHSRDSSNMRGHVSGLFLKLALRGAIRIFTGVDRAGRHFDERLTERVPLVFDETNMVGVDHRHQRDRAAMDHDFPVGETAVGKPNRLQRQVNFQTLENHPPRGLRLIHDAGSRSDRPDF